MRALSTGLAPPRLVAAHLDHALDPGSASRARAAAALAATLDVSFVGERRAVAAQALGVEAAARAERYAFLESVRLASGCRYVVTAHHLDDQAETVALRMLLGSGLAGLRAIRDQLGHVVRPCLKLRRAELAEALAEAGLRGLDDPTNRNERFPRNLLRAAVLPRLTAETPNLAPRLAALAALAARANQAIDRRRLPWFGADSDGAGLRLDCLRSAPAPLQLRALALLHRLSGHELPPHRGAAVQLLAQLAAGAHLGCDCGDGRRWATAGGLLRVVGAAEPRAPSFTYTFPMPGQTLIPELGLVFDVRRAPVEAWMFRGSSWRAGLALPDLPLLEVRNRRPGDRLQPLGAAGTRRLKDVFIDAKVPRAERDRRPLLLAGGEIAWVPGVTVNERFRLDPADRGRSVWLAEVTAG